MKVNVWGINYAPELTGIGVYNTDLCEFLSQAGDQVTVVTGFPYYPIWKKFHKDSFTIYHSERLNGVLLQRCWLFVPSNPTVIFRILHEASFVITSFLRQLCLPRADIYLVISPPLLLGLAAWIIATVKSAPFIFHLQDMQPDAAVGLGMIKQPLMIRSLYRLEKFIYKKSTRVSAISSEICDAIRKKGVEPSKIFLLPNWVLVDPVSQITSQISWKEQHHIDVSCPL